MKKRQAPSSVNLDRFVNVNKDKSDLGSTKWKQKEENGLDRVGTTEITMKKTPYKANTRGDRTNIGRHGRKRRPKQV